jgi:hypothetical protein
MASNAFKVLSKKQRGGRYSTPTMRASYCAFLFFRHLVCDAQAFLFAELANSRIIANSPGNKRVSRLFPVTTDGAKRRPVLGTNRLPDKFEWISRGSAW